MDWLIAAVIGFLFGSVPFGLILTRAAGLGDVRKIGSGSIGATNVLRTGNKGLAAATVLLDAGKAVLAVLLARHLLPGSEAVAAVAAVAGHCFTPWLGFKGGKGFASAAGVLGVLAFPAFFVCAMIWTASIALSRISSLSSLVSVTAAPLVAWGMGFGAALAPLIAIAAIVIVQHRANIGRLLRGQEPRIGAAPGA